MIASKLNNLGNMAAYNPRGQEPVNTAGRDEGYLYWAAWLAHTGSSIYPLQDGNGHYRRIYFTASACALQNIVYGSIPGDDPLTDLGISIITGIPLDLADCT